MLKASKTILLFFVSISLFATEPTDKFGDWFVLNGVFQFPKQKLSVANDLQIRTFEQFKNIQQILFRASLNYHLNKNIAFGLGYVFVDTKTALPEDAYKFHEHRIFQQVQINYNINRLFITNRIRTEQRFLLNVDNQFFFRGRLMVQARVPLNKKALIKNAVYLNTLNEIFLQKNKNNLFDQNRFYAGMGYMPIKQLNIEIGYLNHYVNTIPLHRLHIALLYNIVFEKKKPETESKTN